MMTQKLTTLMQQRERIRNVSIIAHVDHGKTALTESLTHVHMDVGEEKDRGITIKSAAVSLKLKRNEYDEQEKKSYEQEYLINLIDSPGHVDFSSEVTAALRITDGAITVVDCIEGVCVQTETVLRQAILERVKPCLFLNKVDRIWLEKQSSPMETYKLFRKTLESANAICETYKDGSLGNIHMDPIRQNVAFGSGYFGWAITLKNFAEMYGSQFALDTDSMSRRFWGNRYWDSKNRTWVKKRKSDETMLNGFAQFILRPLQVLHNAIMNEDTATYLPIINALRLGITSTELNDCARPKDVLRLVMSRWLPARQAVLDLCADVLPSPVEAQKYRIPNIYTGPLESSEAQDMLACDPNGTLSMYVSKMIPVENDPGRFIAFGRVFSGTVKRGQELRILGGTGSDEDEEKSTSSSRKKKKVQGIIMMMGQKAENLGECPAGNVCGLMGIDKHLTKAGTLSSSEIFPFKTMKFSVSPVVNVAVSVVDSKHLKKLVEGLKRLSKYDNIIQVTQNKQGQQVVSGSGQLHLQTCLNTLKEKFIGSDVQLTTSNPIVSYCEGVQGTNGSTASNMPEITVSKSPNKLNRIFITVERLDPAICEAIESDRLRLCGPSGMKAFGRNFAKQFPSWSKDEAAKIWSFGCPPYATANVLVDCTKSVDYLDKIKASVIEGFKQVTRGGVLCDEPLRGVRINLVDAMVHKDPAHHGPGQIIPAMVRACYGAILSATPNLYEPMYEVSIEVPVSASNGVYNTLGKVRGEPVDRKDKVEIAMCTVVAHIPILETLKNEKEGKKGFTELLRENTQGKAFPVMKFSHWQKVDGDAWKDGSVANQFVMGIRKRKSMKMQIPAFSDYHDRIK